MTPRRVLGVSLLLAACALAACSSLPPAKPVASPRPLVRPRAIEVTPAVPATLSPRPEPVDILSTAPVGRDGIPVLVKKEVDRFSGRHVRLRTEPRPVPGRGGPILVRHYVGEDGSEYTFNAAGVFVTFADKSDSMTSAGLGDSPLSDAQLTAKARGWVRRRFDERQSRWPAKVKRRVAGEGRPGEKKYYEIEVELRFELDGVPAPNFITLRLDRRGEVLGFSRDDGAIDVPTVVPRISKERAVEIVTRQAGGGDAKLVSCELLVERDQQRRTHLAWRVEIERKEQRSVHMMGPTPRVRASVDALSGTLLSFAAGGWH